MLGLMLDLLYMIFVLPFTFCYNLDGCAGWTLEGWGMKAIYRKDAKKQVRKSRTRDGKTEYYWETVSTWNVWNRTGPWQGFGGYYNLFDISLLFPKNRMMFSETSNVPGKPIDVSLAITYCISLSLAYNRMKTITFFRLTLHYFHWGDFQLHC